MYQGGYSGQPEPRLAGELWATAENIALKSSPCLTGHHEELLAGALPLALHTGYALRKADSPPERLQLFLLSCPGQGVVSVQLSTLYMSLTLCLELLFCQIQAFQTCPPNAIHQLQYKYRHSPVMFSSHRLNKNCFGEKRPMTAKTSS